jgi:hypothetical protein
MRVWAGGYHKGLWKAVCDRCGLDHLSNELRLEWTGLRVCNECFEERHPQEAVRGVPESNIPWARPAVDDETPLNVTPEDL